MGKRRKLHGFFVVCMYMCMFACVCMYICIDEYTGVVYMHAGEGQRLRLGTINHLILGLETAIR